MNGNDMCVNLDMPTHTGEHSYYLSCLYPCDACTLRAVHITFHTPPNLLTSPGSRLPWEIMARYPPSLLGRRA